MNQLISLYRNHFGTEPDRIEFLPRSASLRTYYRLWNNEKSIIGTASPDVMETNAFVSFSKHFISKGINVPKVYAVNDEATLYLQQDLGDTLLLNKVEQYRQGEFSPAELTTLYERILDQLIDIQIKGGEGLDYTLSVPRPVFDYQSVMWDLNHFKYYFLKISGVAFSEQLLEDDFVNLTEYLCNAEMKYFMFRDFQSRNIMIFDNIPYFIDFQGGRKGPLQYDPASLLYEAKTALEPDLKKYLLDFYTDKVSLLIHIDKKKFREQFKWWLLVRQLQALGAYGLRGEIEKKALFLQSIPAALRLLGETLTGLPDVPALPELRRVADLLVSREEKYPVLPEPFEGLTVTVTSFSYKKTLPDDLTGNGGGFVYDCRFIRNPGRYPVYAELTGKDPEVDTFFRERTKMPQFIEQVKNQLDEVLRSYNERGYRNLMINFGCTGGRHRSVYAAGKIAAWLGKMYGIRVILRHRELEGSE